MGETKMSLFQVAGQVQSVDVGPPWQPAPGNGSLGFRIEVGGHPVFSR